MSDTKKSNVSYILKAFVGKSEFAAVLGLVILCIALTILSPYFLTVQNIMGVLRQISVICILAIGQQLLLACGCVDLTCGVGLGLMGVIAALFSQKGCSPAVVILLTILAGMLVGGMNGLIITKFNAIPFIITLGTMNIVRGAASLLCNSVPIRFDGPVSILGGGYIGVVPVSVIIMCLFIVAGGVFTSRTKTGRDLFAVGNNEKSCLLSGINVNRTKIIAYLIMGGMIALAGILMAGNSRLADPVTGLGMELDVVAACVIGGASLFGGSGSVLGSFVGAATMGVLKNGFILLGVPQYWQTMAIGIILIVLLCVDVFRKQRTGEMELA